MATYKMMCPLGCGHELSVEAMDDDSAMTMMVDAYKSHVAESHPDEPMKSDEEIMEMVKGGWSKTEDAAPMGEMPMADDSAAAPMA